MMGQPRSGTGRAGLCAPERVSILSRFSGGCDPAGRSSSIRSLKNTIISSRSGFARSGEVFGVPTETISKFRSL